MGMRIDVRVNLRRYNDYMELRLPEGQTTFIVENLTGKALDAFLNLKPRVRDTRHAVRLEYKSELGMSQTLRNGSHVTLTHDGTPFWDDIVQSMDPTFSAR